MKSKSNISKDINKILVRMKKKQKTKNGTFINKRTTEKKATECLIKRRVGFVRESEVM